MPAMGFVFPLKYETITHFSHKNKIIINNNNNKINKQQATANKMTTQEMKTTKPDTNAAAAAAEIVYMVAPSGTGKTFTGDYLALLQGYEHVDGDGPLKNKHLPQYSDIAAKWWKNCVE